MLQLHSVKNGQIDMTLYKLILNTLVGATYSEIRKIAISITRYAVSQCLSVPGVEFAHDLLLVHESQGVSISLAPDPRPVTGPFEFMVNLHVTPLG